MTYGLSAAKMVDAARVYLDQENPRHEAFEDQSEVIAYLCEHEQVLALARDVADHGLNPLELFAVVAEGPNAFVAIEGNRRLCALKLLNDPDLAPTKLRAEFKKAAARWTQIDELFCSEFPDRSAVKLWLDRIHGGANHGRGRRPWKAEQKARHSGRSKNRLALAVLDVGESQGLISIEERVGRLSTVQRYLGNPVMKDVLGVESKAGLEPTTVLPDADFNRLLESFLRDVAEKKINTRASAKDIASYARELESVNDLSGEREEPRPLGTPSERQKSRRSKKQPKRRSKIRSSSSLEQALEEVGSSKLEQLYHSLTSVSLTRHTILLAVGAWSFLESLTSRCGRNPQTSFPDFLAASKLRKLGLGENRDTKAIRQALRRVSEHGNTTKHDSTAALFNGEQLANDFETLEGLLVLLAREAKSND